MHTFILRLCIIASDDVIILKDCFFESHALQIILHILLVPPTFYSTDINAFITANNEGAVVS